MDRASLECFNGAALLFGLLIGAFVVQGARIIRASFRDPVPPPEEPPPTPVIGDDEQ